MAISRGVKSTRQDLSGATHATSWGTAPTAGQKVIVYVWAGTSTDPTSVVDNGSPQRTFTIAKKSPGTASCGWTYYADNVQPSGTYTVTVTWAASQFGSCFGYSYNNVATGGPTASNAGTAATSTTCNSGAASETNNALYASTFSDDGGGACTQTEGGSFTKEDSLETGASFTEGNGSDQINATGSQTASITLQFTRNDAMSIAVWPEAAAAATTATIAYGYGSN